jgi:ElaB/YqjD/DUF883 family membrane-anchored ribosome-binding protein
MEQNGTAPGDSFGTLKKNIADTLERAANSLGKETETGNAPGPYSQQASRWLLHSADYVRELDIKKADLELRNQIRSHPGQSILIGLVTGVLVGIWLRRR